MYHCAVAPFTGAWIEIIVGRDGSSYVWSLPSRERGLKCIYDSVGERDADVAPFTGAWIEIDAFRQAGGLA